MTTKEAFLDAAVAEEIKALIAEAERIKAEAEKLLPVHIVAFTRHDMPTLGIGLMDEELFTRKVPPEMNDSFNTLFARLAQLPEIETKFVKSSLSIADISPREFNRYTQPGHGPQFAVYPSVLKAVIGGLMLIDGATSSADIAMRHFFIISTDLCESARHRQNIHEEQASLHKWRFRPEPASPEVERKAEEIRQSRHDYAARYPTLRDQLLSLFKHLEPRHLKIMNERLKHHRPVFVVEKNETPDEAYERTQREWAGFRDGTRTVGTLMNELKATDDPVLSYQLAIYIQISTQIWPFLDRLPLMTFGEDSDTRQIFDTTFGDSPAKPKPKLN